VAPDLPPNKNNPTKGVQMNLLKHLRRIKGYLQRSRLFSPGFWDEVLTDPRSRQGRRWNLDPVVKALLAGMVTGCPTLRDTEELSTRLAERGRFGIDRRVPDTTMDSVLRILEPSEFEGVLEAQMRSAERSKSLKCDLVPLGLVSFDGKSVWYGTERVHPTCQLTHTSQGEVRYHLRVLRAALVSSSARPCLGQYPIPPETNEMGWFKRAFQQFLSAYGGLGLVAAVRTDPGMCSLPNATLIKESSYDYIMAMKEGQIELMREARRLLAHRTTPDAVMDWEPHKEGQIRRELWRTDEIAGWLDWTHLVQAWRVRSTVRKRDGEEVTEERWFITSLPTERLSALGCLKAVRYHWGIENNVFGTLDREWLEDNAPWCRQGNALLVVTLLRLLAYNILTLLRSRRLRSKHNRCLAWRIVFRRVWDALWLEERPRRMPAAT
jgi:hypothetical protein